MLLDSSLPCPAEPCPLAVRGCANTPLPSGEANRIESMGSSSNTNTSGGGSDKEEMEDKGKGKDSSEPSFKEGDRVLAYHGPLLYEAKVQRIESLEDEWRYFVHYLGWNKNWDEWVANDRLLKLTEDNIRKQQELEKNQAVDKTIKSGRSMQHKLKGFNGDAKADKDDTKSLVKGKKRKSQPGTEEKEKRSSESLLVSQIPSTLKKQLVDDWEYVTQLGKLVKLPRSPTVDDILKKYLEHRAKKDSKINGSYAEILKGLRCYFDEALPTKLLYKKERDQYAEVKGDVSPSTVYGAEHLLRLFVKLPELLAYVNMEEDALNKLHQELLDILKFIQKNQSTFFVSYDVDRKGADGSKSK